MSAHVVSIVNPSGGSGKTTLAVNLACEIAKRDRVLLIDLDPQGSVTAWWSRVSSERSTDQPQDRESLKDCTLVTAACAERSLIEFLSAPTRARYDLVVIDCSPLSSLAQSTFAVSDSCLVPVIPDWRSASLLRLLEANHRTFANQSGRVRPPLGVVTSMRGAPSLPKEAQEALESGSLNHDLFSAELPYFGSTDQASVASTLPRSESEIASSMAEHVTSVTLEFERMIGSGYRS